MDTVIEVRNRENAAPEVCRIPDGTTLVFPGGGTRVTRGGADFEPARNLRSANRASMFPGVSMGGTGFRIMCGEPVSAPENDGHGRLLHFNGNYHIPGSVLRISTDNGAMRGIAGIHAAMVQLKDGSLLAIGRSDECSHVSAFQSMAPQSVSKDGGKTWCYSAGLFPNISSAQRPSMMHLRESQILFVSFTDAITRHDAEGTGSHRTVDQLTGLEFAGINGQSTPSAGYGMFAALSFDEGKTWPVRRLIADGPERTVTTIDNGTVKFGGKYSELTGYLALAQGYDGTIHLISSKNHYAFNLARLMEYADETIKGMK